MIHNLGPTDARRYRQEAQTVTLRKPFHRGPGEPDSEVTPIDCDAEYWSIVNNIKQQRDNRLRMPTVKLFDGNWILRGRVAHAYTASFQEIDGETGSGKIEMPVDYYLSQWVINHDGRTTKNIHVTVDKDGVRWSGRMDHYEIEKQQDGTMICRVLFKHDFEELKHILCWVRPPLKFWITRKTRRGVDLAR
uniref:Gp37-like protein n=1 Tax=Nocardia jiangxiensis TaxID=282685 RepID=UPI0002FE3995|nr:hypothetical protein [Nocardia jiangxiensis]